MHQDVRRLLAGIAIGGVAVESLTGHGQPHTHTGIETDGALTSRVALSAITSTMGATVQIPWGWTLH